MARKSTSMIVVHCAATKPSMDIGRREIDRWHRERGWRGIGYHFVIRRDGTVETGRPVDEPGAHVTGHNATSVGVCLVGGLSEAGKPQSNFTQAQYEALIQLLSSLTSQYPAAEVLGHNDLAPKDCPCFDVKQWWAEVRPKTSHIPD